ncbi:MAG: WbqC family protein [Bacteroidales bacterium]|nr:WbqC family protein [Bacteroidales bacterium]
MSSRASQTDRQFDCSLLSTAYFAPVEYFAAIANSERVLVERCEIFQKQSYRTRCHIYGANGLLSLSVPVLRGSDEAVSESIRTHKLLIDKVKIDYSKPWVQQHSRAMDAAYMTTPFYEYYRDDIMAILESGEEYLFNLNSKLLELFCEMIGLSAKIDFTEEWKSADAQDKGITDLREVIHPKYKGENLLQRLQIERPYYQVFSNKGGFIGNLSILDLLCNEGPNSISFLLK